jgi:peptidyl-prolyl cis-trans isomerase SDCCAG10
MSSVYTSQPATKGKVILVTSAGDLEIELWPKETPKTCRNFIQLCMEGYYDDTPIHRIIPKFIVQAGDPTGTGLGGESIYGAPFADEFHSRLKFSHRGLLAMANTGTNTNGSQFFFTLDATPQLNGKNTIFGKIVGNTLFNLLKLGELETDKNDKPLFDARIITSKILANPFDDIEPRTTREEKVALAKQQEIERLAAEKASKPKTKKNLSLLSFGNSAVPDSTIIHSKIKSSHDVLGESAGLSSKVAVDPSIVNKKRKMEQEEPTEEQESEKYEKKMREKALKKVAALPETEKKEYLVLLT